MNAPFTKVRTVAEQQSSSDSVMERYVLLGIGYFLLNYAIIVGVGFATAWMRSTLQYITVIDVGGIWLVLALISTAFWWIPSMVTSCPTWCVILPTCVFATVPACMFWDPSFTSEQLAEDFQTKPLEAQNLYVGVKLDVVGKVQGISKLNQPKELTVTLDGTGPVGVECRFLNRWPERVAGLQVGQVATINGKCTGLEKGNVVIVECRIPALE